MAFPPFLLAFEARLAVIGICCDFLAVIIAFADGFDIQARDKRSVSGGTEKDRTAGGNRDKWVSWLSSRAPALDWPAILGQVNQNRNRKSAEGLYIESIYRVSYRVPADVFSKDGNILFRQEWSPFKPVLTGHGVLAMVPGA
jgi:hypothetical protein